MPVQLTAEPIQTRTKGDVKRLRRTGYIPVSVQHRGEPTLHYQQELKPLEEHIRKHGQAMVIDLVVSGGQQRHTVLVHDIQRDPVSHHLLQVTFQRVAQDEQVKAHVPVVLTGEPAEVREGTAVIEHPTAELEVQALPANLPPHIAVDISGIDHAHPLRVADLAHSDKYEVLTAPDTVLAALTTARKAVEEVEEQAAEEGEPPAESGQPSE